MIEWLKTSIPGIIILGAIGSMLAVGILKLAVTLLRRFAPPLRKHTIGRVLIFLRAPRYLIEHLHSSDDSKELIVTCIFVLAQFIFMALAMCMGFLMIVVGAASQSLSGHRFPLIVFLGSLLFFLSTFFTLHYMSILTLIYYSHMKQTDAAAIVQSRGDVDDEFNKRA
jgi:hypothetical protein